MIHVDNTGPRVIILYENASEAEQIISTIIQILGTAPFTATLLASGEEQSGVDIYTNATFKQTTPIKKDDHVCLDLLTPDSTTGHGVFLSIWPSTTEHPTPTLDITPSTLTVRIPA